MSGVCDPGIFLDEHRQALCTIFWPWSQTRHKIGGRSEGHQLRLDGLLQNLVDRLGEARAQEVFQAIDTYN